MDVNRYVNDNYTVDALAWLCKVIIKHKNPRYKDLLKKVADEARSRKLRRYAKRALESLPSHEVEQFIPTKK
ncbi:hypothetical protein [Aliikangiella sp. IMCC44359]|uniref:hypothetical protein n=1 Tax=Aliikangiella sp. IMCC44359 TaxID=3459125 RepID=UPI00403A9B5C